MAGLTAERNTPEHGGKVFPYPVAAGAKIYAGALVAVDASGNLVPAADTAGLHVVGRAEASYDNTSGAAGVEHVPVKRGTFKWDVSGTALAGSDIGATMYATDDHTVAKASTNTIAAGVLKAIEGGKAWVETR